MRIGCLQFITQVGDIDNNIQRAEALLKEGNPENLDLLALPELAFAGYNFKSRQEITPFLEIKGSGISALWAQKVARELNCVVTIGYPEKADIETDSTAPPKYYNSVIAVNAAGETLAHYRKAFLYYTDDTWALEGEDGFYGGPIPGLGITSMGICMDLNPYKFKAPWGAFEFAFHCLRVEANLVIVTMAWNTFENSLLFSQALNEPDMKTLKYWLARLEPIIRSQRQEEMIIVFCNRCGTESDTIYVGTSSVVGVKGDEINLYGALGRGEEELLVVDTEKPPCAKFVYCFDDESPETTPCHDDTSCSKEIGQTDSQRIQSEMLE